VSYTKVPQSASDPWNPLDADHILKELLSGKNNEKILLPVVWDFLFLVYLV